MDLPISALPNATLPLAGDEIVPLVQSGQTRQAPISVIGGGGGYVSLSSSQSCTGITNLEVTGPPVNAIVEVTLHVAMTLLTTPDMFGLVVSVPGVNSQNIDGPVNGFNGGSTPNLFTASSSWPSPNLVPTSSCYFTLTTRTLVFASGSVSATVYVGGAFVGTFDAFLTIDQVSPTPFL